MNLSFAARANAYALLAALACWIAAELAIPFGSPFSGGTTFYDPSALSGSKIFILNAAVFLQHVVVILMGTGLSVALLILSRQYPEAR